MFRVGARGKVGRWKPDLRMERERSHYTERQGGREGGEGEVTYLEDTGAARGGEE